MTAWLNGREALATLDAQVARLRQVLADALAAADAAELRRAEVQKEQAGAYNALAALHLDRIQEEPASAFGTFGLAARDLAERQSAFVAAEQAALERAAAVLAAREAERTALAEAHDAAVAAYEAEVAATETTLKQSAEYAALVAAAEEARAVTQRAAQKLELARADRAAKGAPYEQDPLFSYLWKRRFRSPEYKAGPFIRFLDGWVARVCRYDDAFLNYQRLTELPERIAEHAAFVAELESKAEAALVEAEEDAMRQSDAAALKTKADALKADIAACDATIAAAEEHYRETARRHEEALNDAAGPAVEARALLEAELRRLSFPDLRVIAAETTDRADDALVDTLVRLRAEEMSIELEGGGRLQRPRLVREELASFEALRRQFKEARFDSPYALMPRAALDEMMARVARGETNIADALRRLSRAIRRADPEAHPDFGGRRRHETIGLPDVLGGVVGGVLGEVLEEVMRETTRSGGGRGRGPIFPGPPSRSSRPPPIGGGRSSFPRGGGFGGGGGRRGGGFRTGGGF